ncbi:MAG: hypothetical protein KC417_13860, partial [Myxococcales bacterium]|nr:hypothetical protein [Myxococcales bacterium]
MMQSIYPATRTLARSSFLIALVAVAGCGNSKSEGGKAPNPAAHPPPASSGERHVSATFDDRQVHQDLVQTAFLADVEDRGVL